MKKKQFIILSFLSIELSWIVIDIREWVETDEWIWVIMFLGIIH